MITNLHLIEFRGFSDLQLDGLGRVNLIVGPNSSGKTSLLEALYLASSRSDRIDGIDVISRLPTLFRSNHGMASGDYVKWMSRSKNVPFSIGVTDALGEKWELNDNKAVKPLRLKGYTTLPSERSY